MFKKNIRQIKCELINLVNTLISTIVIAHKELSSRIIISETSYRSIAKFYSVCK